MNLALFPNDSHDFIKKCLIIDRKKEIEKEIEKEKIIIDDNYIDEEEDEDGRADSTLA